MSNATSATCLSPLPPTSDPGRGQSGPHIADGFELRAGLAAENIDGHLMRATNGLDICNRILAFYLDELHESCKHKDLGYSCLAQYADQRLGIEPRRARELCQAGRALITLSRIDAACRAGRLCWTKTELLTHGVQESEQDEWLERAQRVSSAELKQMLRRHRKGLSIEKGRDGGLPRSEFDVHATLPVAAHDKLEQVRQMLMCQRGEFVDDSDALAYVLEKFELPAPKAAAEVERTAAIEHGETPDWLRRKVLARDDHHCQACGKTGNMHVHHIVFRSRDGLTREENLTTTCLACHSLIHEGRLFASGRAPEVEFRNKAGGLLVSRDATASEMSGASAMPRAVLRLLREDGGGNGGGSGGGAGGGGGGQPPHPSSAGGSPRFLSEDEIPEEITREWLREHLHLFDLGRDGVCRLKRSARRRRRNR